jgi:hypothetical protein
LRHAVAAVTDEDPPIPEEPEVVDGLPVLSSDDAHTAIEPSRRPALIQPKQVAALAATGFVAGAATVAIVHRRRKALPGRPLARRLGTGAAKKKTNGMLLGEVVTSQSFLVDVHVLRRD